MSPSWKIFLMAALLVVGGLIIASGIKRSAPAILIEVESYVNFTSSLPVEEAVLKIRNPSRINFSYGMEVQTLTNGHWSVWNSPLASPCSLGQCFIDQTITKDESVTVPAGPVTWRLQMQVYQMPGEWKMKLDSLLNRLHLASSSDAPDFLVYSQPFVKTNSLFRLSEPIR